MYINLLMIYHCLTILKCYLFIPPLKEICIVSKFLLLQYFNKVPHLCLLENMCVFLKSLYLEVELLSYKIHLYVKDAFCEHFMCSGPAYMFSQNIFMFILLILRCFWL